MLVSPVGQTPLIKKKARNSMPASVQLRLNSSPLSTQPVDQTFGPDVYVIIASRPRRADWSRRS